VRLPFATVCAILEDAGYRRDQIKDLTIGYVRRVVQHARDEKGRVEFERPAASKPDPENTVVAWLKRRNYPAHLIGERTREILREQEEMRARAKQAKRQPRPHTPKKPKGKPGHGE